MIPLIIIIVLIILALGSLISSTSNTDKNNNLKEATAEYLSNFNMYLCMRNKLLLYPPKEIRIHNGYYTLNLSASNNLLPHRNINAATISKDRPVCNECLHRCSLKVNEFIDLNLSFNDYRQMSNETFKKYLKSHLTEEQFNRLFNE